MAKSKNFKVKSTKKAAPKVEINEGTYVDTAVNNTKSGDGAGWRSSGVQAPAAGQGVDYVGAKNPGKMAISELPGQYTAAIPVPTKPKKPAPGKKSKK